MTPAKRRPAGFRIAASIAILACVPLQFARTDAPGESPALPRESRVPGGIAILDLGAGQEPPGAVIFNDHRAPVLRMAEGWVALVGIPLEAAPGPNAALLRSASGAPDRKIAFEVAPKKYDEQRLKVAEKRHVDPSTEDLERIARERTRIDAALGHYSTEFTPQFALQPPVSGRRSSSFGLRRFFNDQPRNPHTGMDIAAPTGTPILSPAPGRVLDTGDFFFNGNTVFVDHGLGVVTIYCHLHRIDVQPGDEVATGTPLGQVGSTGRVTGPHLHWGVAVNRALVDPALFLVEPAATPGPDQ